MPRLVNTILALLFAVQGSSLAQAQLQVEWVQSFLFVRAFALSLMSFAPQKRKAPLSQRELQLTIVSDGSTCHCLLILCLVICKLQGCAIRTLFFRFASVKKISGRSLGFGLGFLSVGSCLSLFVDKDLRPKAKDQGKKTIPPPSPFPSAPKLSSISFRLETSEFGRRTPRT